MEEITVGHCEKHRHIKQGGRHHVTNVHKH